MAEKHTSSFSSLRFDKKLLSSIQAKYLSNIRLVLLLLMFILAVGVVSVLTLPRRLNPEIKLTIVQVLTILPGASPTDIESLVTTPLEDKLTGLSRIDTITSTSQESTSVIAIQFLSNTDKDKARTDVQNAVNEVTSLPSDVKTPTVTAFDFERQPIWTFALTTKGDKASLMRFSDSLKKKLEDMPHVDSVSLSGFDTQEIQVIQNEEKIRTLKLNPLQVSQMIKTATQAFPAGQIDNGKFILSLGINQQATSAEEIRNLILPIGGVPLRLGDVADVVIRSKIGQSGVFLADGKKTATPAVTFAVFKTTSADIDKTVTEVEKEVEEDIKKTNGQFEIQSVNNAGEEIGKQFTDLLSEFQSTLILVFINLFLFLGLRQALLAMLTIPLTFLLSFTWMNLFGQSINFISLFAFLLAFGTSIDDTIVTVSAVTAYNRTKKFTPLETGLLIWRDFIVPIWATTMTTVWAFLPLILTAGIIGEFIKPIPLVVAATMYSSTFVSWFITLPIMIVLLHPKFPRRVKIAIAALIFLGFTGVLIVLSPKNIFLAGILPVFVGLLWITYMIRQNLVKRLGKTIEVKPVSVIWQKLKTAIAHGVINMEPAGEKYRQLIVRILESTSNRRIVLICLFAFMISAYLLVPFGLVKNEFFPKSDNDSLSMTLEMPAGTDLETVTQETKSLLNSLRTIPEAKSVTAVVGQGSATGFGGGQSGSNLSSFTLILTPKETRKTDSGTIAQDLRKKFANFQKGKISIVESSGGPPAGSDIQIKLIGTDLTVLNHLADRTTAFLKKTPGITNADKSIRGGTGKIVFVPNQTKLAQTGVSLDSLALWLRIYASGLTLDQVKFADTDQDVVFYISKTDQNPDDLATISVPTPKGDVTLSELGSFRLESNPTAITHEDGKRTISVSAGVLAGYSVSETNQKLEKFAASDLKLPDGYSWQTGGVNEENQKSVNSIFQAMGLSFILIMATMIIEFKSYRQAAMILALIPLAISGVFIIFGLTGTPLSFPALIGVLALFGVVVTNAMFIVEKINQNRASGMKLIEAIADAGKSRLEPILLTSLTSILGLVPITIANPLWRGLGGAIISGLMFSGIIMLFFIPVMYYFIYRETEKK